jgi:hypothetical protein
MCRRLGRRCHLGGMLGQIRPARQGAAVGVAPQGHVLWQLMSLSLAATCQSQARGGADFVYDNFGDYRLGY